MNERGRHNPDSEAKQLRIAVIGAGVAGITAAYLLGKRYRVTLYEKNRRIGGHTNTVVIDAGPDAGTPVDTGFIVCNDRTYPGLHKLFEEWGVSVQKSNMSFSYYSETSGLQYAGTGPNGLFAQRSNLARPAFWRFLADIPRFGANGLRDLASGAADGLTLDQYLGKRGYSSRLIHDYIIPMGAAIWSSPPATMRAYPAEAFLRFFKNHGLLKIRDMPQWQSVRGGSHSYLKAFRRAFTGRIVTNADITAVQRTPDSAIIRRHDREDERFDYAIIATHADEALALLAEPGERERSLLGMWRYQNNRTVLHTDTNLLPPNRRAWASWNYRRERGQGESHPLSVTYHMNRLQRLNTSLQYCVTLNTSHTIDPARIIASFDYTHPLYTFESIESREKLKELNKTGRIRFCGSYFGNGFHEDAVQSAMAVVRPFDGTTGPVRTSGGDAP